MVILGHFSKQFYYIMNCVTKWKNEILSIFKNNFHLNQLAYRITIFIFTLIWSTFLQYLCVMCTQIY
jgi:hypothetical protein